MRFIYQELNLVRELDIARNMFLGMEPMSLPFLNMVNQRKLYGHAAELLERFHIDLDPTEVVGKLSVTQQKIVEIARALTTQARVIVLDEPTDVLEDKSKQDLFQVIEQLKKEQDVGFIYISHRYAEVYELGDRVTILRDGNNVGTYNIGDLAFDTMIERMIGGEIQKQYPDLPPPTHEDALHVENIRRKGTLNGVDLTLKRGEIVGVTGLMGAGKTKWDERSPAWTRWTTELSMSRAKNPAHHARWRDQKRDRLSHRGSQDPGPGAGPQHTQQLCDAQPGPPEFCGPGAAPGRSMPRRRTIWTS